MKKKIILKRVFHRDRGRILISFNYDESLVSLIRQINGYHYSNTHKSWYADDNEETLKRILLVFRDKADIDVAELTQNKKEEDFKVPEENTKIFTPGLQNDVDNINPETKYSKTKIIPSQRIIEKAIERSRFCPVEFRINEKDGKLAVKFTGFSSRRFIWQELRRMLGFIV